MHAPDSVTVGGDSLIIHGVFAPLQWDSPRRRYVSPVQHLLQYNRPQAARGVCKLVSSQQQHHEPPNGVARMCVVCVCAVLVRCAFCQDVNVRCAFLKNTVQKYCLSDGFSTMLQARKKRFFQKNTFFICLYFSKLQRNRPPYNTFF